MRRFALPTEPAGHADLFGGAPTTLGRDHQAVHSLSCIRIAGEQTLDGVQVAVIRRGAELGSAAFAHNGVPSAAVMSTPSTMFSTNAAAGPPA